MLIEHIYRGGPLDGERFRRHAPGSRRRWEAFFDEGIGVATRSKYVTIYDPELGPQTIWEYRGDEPKPPFVLQAEIEVPDNA